MCSHSSVGQVFTLVLCKHSDYGSHMTLLHNYIVSDMCALLRNLERRPESGKNTAQSVAAHAGSTFIGEYYSSEVEILLYGKICRETLQSILVSLVSQEP